MKIFITTLAFFLLLNNAMAQKDSTKKKSMPAIEGSFEVNYFKQYLWRGLSFGNDNVAQPSLMLKYKNFYLELEQNFNYIPKNVPKEFYRKQTSFDEQDISIGYSKEWRKFESEFAVNAYFYFYQIGSPNTAEIYNKTSYSTGKNSSIFSENSIDFIQYRGSVYSNNGFSWQREFEKRNLAIEATLFAGLGTNTFNEVYTGARAAGLNLVGTSIEIEKTFNKHYFVKLYGEENYFTRKELQSIYGKKTNGNYGLSFGFNFKIPKHIHKVQQ